ncbi:MAG TPA: hypothetical protein VD963_00335 [Phycisphaerales bacterium]|nr:hypothetical protein [Phycisphaerales bacterium]
MKTVNVLAALAGLGLAGAALGQTGTGFTITDGTAVFTQGNTPTTVSSSGPTSDLKFAGPTGQDQLFKTFWWYRVDGVHTRENAFNNQVGPTVVAGNSATQNFATPEFTAVLNYGVLNVAGTALLTQTMTITPLVQGNLHLFNYADYFVNGADANDVVSLVNPNNLRVTDVHILDHIGALSGAYQAGPFNSILGQLTNTSVTNLANTVDGTPGDREGGFQWTIAMVPGQPLVLTSVISVPGPGSLALLGLGGLVAARRRRA